MRVPPMALIGATNQQKIHIFEEINETHPNKLEQNKELLKQWINTQPHLPKNYDERILDSIIRGCKHDVERAKKKVDYIFTYRSIMPDLFLNRDPTTPEIKNIRNFFLAVPLPHLAPNGCRIMFFKYMPEDTSTFDVKLFVKYLLMLGEIRMIEEGPISGDIFIYDVGAVTASFAAKLLNPVVKKGIMVAQNAMPQRLKQIHCINAPGFLDAGINFVKKFVKPKIRDRFFVYKGFENLYKYVPQDMLPSDYGGKEKSMDALQNEWYKKLESYRPYLEEQESIHSDESKRMNDSLAMNEEHMDMFGTTGSFHKLNID